MKIRSASALNIRAIRPDQKSARACHAEARRRRAFTLPQLRARPAFTLIELLVVIAIIVILSVLVVPAFTNLKSAGDVTGAAYTIKGVLDQARTYAMANNTYTWVGFYEETTTATSPTNRAPAYSGVGRLLLATVFSIDGTKIYEDSDPAAALPQDRFKQLGKLVCIDNVHVTDIGAPAGGNSDSLDGRPAVPYTDFSPFDHYNRISSNSADTAQFRFTAQNYTFYKTIRFSPRGEANILYAGDPNISKLKHAEEIGMKPTHGTVVDTNNTNIAAVQISGIAGNVKIYRR